jgi:hypothetical protein
MGQRLVVLAWCDYAMIGHDHLKKGGGEVGTMLDVATESLIDSLLTIGVREATASGVQEE